MHLRPNEGKWEATRLGPSLEQKVVEEMHGVHGYLQMLPYFYNNQGQFETNSAAQEMKKCIHCMRCCQLPIEGVRHEKALEVLIPKISMQI